MDITTLVDTNFEPDRASLSGGPTFAEAAEQWFTEVVPIRRPRSVQNVRSMLNFHILPVFGDRPLRSIGKKDIKALIREIGTTRKHKAGPYGSRTEGCQGRANSVHWLLKSFFGWASDENSGELIDTNPSMGLKTPFPYGERERWLSDDEIRWFWKAAQEEGYPCGTAARLLLLTGARRSEIGLLRKHEIDRKARTATVPIARSKTGRGHIIPLSTLSLELLDTIPRCDDMPWLFSLTGLCPVSSRSYSDANKRMHVRMSKLARQEIENEGRDPAEAFIEYWTYHDLRRTCATALCALGIPLHVIDKQLNHAGGSGGTGRTLTAVTRIYCRWEFMRERAAALDAMSNYVSALVAADADVPALVSADARAAAISGVPEIVRLPAPRAA